MGVNDQQTTSAYDQLSKPGVAARRFNELLDQDSWAVLGLGFNDLHPLTEHYGPAWHDNILDFVAQLLFATRDQHGTPADLLAYLTKGTYLVITEAATARAIVEMLHHRFRQEIVAKFPADDICEGLVCLSETERLPLPSLAIGQVTAEAGPFANPRELLNAVTEARNQQERLAIQQELNALTFSVGRLREEVLVAQHAPPLVPRIERFAEITTGPIHDLRNGLSILHEEARKLTEQLPGQSEAADLLIGVRYARFLLETGSEIRFRGGSSPAKINLVDHLREDAPLWQAKIEPTLQVNLPDQAIEVYADRIQVIQTLFNLLRWFKQNAKAKNITITGQAQPDYGEIILSGLVNLLDLGEDTLTQALVKQGLSDLGQNHRPWLYVFEKVFSRSGGQLDLTGDQLRLRFPVYRWQDVQAADTLAEQRPGLRAKIADLETQLSTFQVEKNERLTDYTLKGVLSLGEQVITELVAEFAQIRQTAARHSQPGDETQQALWASIEASSHFCQLLTANLAALEGALITTPEPTDVAQVLESVRRMLRSKIENVAELEWRVADNLPPVAATPTALAQVLLNLILNALEELAQSQPAVARLRVATRQSNEAVVIEVADTGGGLPPQVAAQLFEEAVSTRRHVEGGIGLKVVKSILDALNSDIEFESQPDEGTTVTLTLPIWTEA